ncbi:MAG: CNNM domain-containing protein, partial [Roseibacillus sp.]|nr:CNNM domain-containing protein [Roseibacillus sp.]
MSSPHQFLLASGSEMPTSFPGWNELLLYLTGIFIFLVLNAFFVAVEFALVKVRKSQVLEAQAKGARDSHLALRALSQLDG